MSNGSDAEKYLLDEVDQHIKKKQEMAVDFSKCPVGGDYAKDSHVSQLLLLKMLRIQFERATTGQNGKNGIVLGNGIQLTGWGGVAAAIAYLILKTHGVL